MEHVFFTYFYRSPSQDHDKLFNFCSEPNVLPTNINNNQAACSILIGDFNVKCSKWWTSDRNNIAGLEIDEPTHFINGTSSCIDLIFSSNVRFIKNYGIEQSIYEKCHCNHYIWYSSIKWTSTSTLL